MKQTTSVGLATVLLAATFLIDSCVALKCYTCDSSKKQNCVDPNDAKFAASQNECSDDKVNDLLAEIKDPDLIYVLRDTFGDVKTQPWYCTKVEFTELGTKRTIRHCGKGPDYCDTTVKKFKTFSEKGTTGTLKLNATLCSVCDTELCNKGTLLNFNSNLIFFAAAAILCSFRMLVFN